MQKLQVDDYVLEGVVQADFGVDLAFVGEETNEVDGGVVFAEGEDLAFIGGDGDGSTMGCDGDKHVLVVESVEAFAHEVVGEGGGFVAVLVVGEFVPLKIHW